MRIDIARAAELLRENDDILVLCHAHPDGDTLGCGYALMHMLQSLGKRCRLECADEIAPKYSFMAEGLENFGDFEPKFITDRYKAALRRIGGEVQRQSRSLHRSPRLEHRIREEILR